MSSKSFQTCCCCFSFLPRKVSHSKQAALFSLPHFLLPTVSSQPLSKRSDYFLVMGPGQKFLTWVGSGQPFMVWVWIWKISLLFFLLGSKKSVRVGSKSTRVKGRSASFLLRVKSKLGSGQGSSLQYFHFICFSYQDIFLILPFIYQE